MDFLDIPGLNIAQESGGKGWNPANGVPFCARAYICRRSPRVAAVPSNELGFNLSDKGYRKAIAAETKALLYDLLYSPVVTEWMEEFPLGRHDKALKYFAHNLWACKVIPNGRQRTVRFGTASNYVSNPRKTARDRAAYIARHRVNENHGDPLTPGALSRWLLWGESRSLARNTAAFRRRFRLQ